MSEYSAADITVLEFDAAVRRRPWMYLGAEPHVATNVLTAVVVASLHPGTKVAPAGPPDVTAEILGGLTFSIADNWPISPDGSPTGYFGSLLGPWRWVHAAAAAVSIHTTVETWHAGRALRQDLTGVRPTGPPRDFPAPTGTGTKLTYQLDPAWFEPSILTTALAALHAEGCCDPPGTFHLRDGCSPTVWRVDE